MEEPARAVTVDKIAVANLLTKILQGLDPVPKHHEQHYFAVRAFLQHSDISERAIRENLLPALKKLFTCDVKNISNLYRELGVTPPVGNEEIDYRAPSQQLNDFISGNEDGLRKALRETFQAYDAQFTGKKTQRGINAWFAETPFPGAAGAVLKVRKAEKTHRNIKQIAYQHLLAAFLNGWSSEDLRPLVFQAYMTDTTGSFAKPLKNIFDKLPNSENNLKHALMKFMMEKEHTKFFSTFIFRGNTATEFASTGKITTKPLKAHLILLYRALEANLESGKILAIIQKILDNKVQWLSEIEKKKKNAKEYGKVIEALRELRATFKDSAILDMPTIQNDYLFSKPLQKTLEGDKDTKGGTRLFTYRELRTQLLIQWWFARLWKDTEKEKIVLIALLNFKEKFEPIKQENEEEPTFWAHLAARLQELARMDNKQAIFDDRGHLLQGPYPLVSTTFTLELVSLLAGQSKNNISRWLKEMEINFTVKTLAGCSCSFADNDTAAPFLSIQEEIPTVAPNPSGFFAPLEEKKLKITFLPKHSSAMQSENGLKLLSKILSVYHDEKLAIPPEHAYLNQLIIDDRKPQAAPRSGLGGGPH